MRGAANKPKSTSNNLWSQRRHTHNDKTLQTWQRSKECSGGLDIKVGLRQAQKWRVSDDLLLQDFCLTGRSFPEASSLLHTHSSHAPVPNDEIVERGGFERQDRAC